MLSDVCVPYIKRLTSVSNLRSCGVVVKFGQTGLMLIAGTPNVLLSRGTGKKQTNGMFFSFTRMSKINCQRNSTPVKVCTALIVQRFLN